MKLFKTIFLFWALFFTSVAFALDAPKNVVLDKAFEDKLEISWDAVDGWELYAISYWTKPAWTGAYENELEIISDEWNKAVIENLTPSTKYYIAVKSYDSLSNDSEYSQEVSFSTSWEVWDLKIWTIDVINAKQINISFNVNLKSDQEPIVNIVNLNDDLESVETLKYEIDANILEIHLSNDLNKQQKYSATVVSIEWDKSEKIKAWVDGIANFETPNEFPIKNEEDDSLDTPLKSAPEEEKQNNNDSSTLDPEPKKESNDDSKPTKALGWKDMDKSEVKLIEAVSKDKKDLPTTWPTEILLFLLLSFIISALIVLSRKKDNI